MITKWEYRSERFDTDVYTSEAIVRDLNGLGYEGWELVAVTPGNGYYRMWLKRPVAP
jgi:hypothetical protein